MLLDFILPGIVVGVGAALSPGPLLLLIVSETLRGGIRAGWSIAVTPLITDIPFVIASMVLARGIGGFRPLVGVLSLLGAAFLCFLAYQNATISRADLEQPAGAPASLAKGIIANLLNPHLYLFWFSVALPVFAKGNILGSSTFAVALLLSAVAAMMGLALIVAIIRVRILHYLHWIIRTLGVLLLIVAILFVREGVALLHTSSELGFT